MPVCGLFIHETLTVCLRSLRFHGSESKSMETRHRPLIAPISLVPAVWPHPSTPSALCSKQPVPPITGPARSRSTLPRDGCGTARTQGPILNFAIRSARGRMHPASVTPGRRGSRADGCTYPYHHSWTLLRLVDLCGSGILQRAFA